jgi:hypothetical protein
VNILCFRYNNIYTSEGLTLHKLALELQDGLNSNGFSKANKSGFDDYPNLTSPGICFMENVSADYFICCKLSGFMISFKSTATSLWPL